MLQLSVAGTRDYELRIPTKIRSIVIKQAQGTDDGQISVRDLPWNHSVGTVVASVPLRHFHPHAWGAARHPAAAGTR